MAQLPTHGTTVDAEVICQFALAHRKGEGRATRRSCTVIKIAFQPAADGLMGEVEHTVIEALACGDRVVMTDLPGVKEWIDTYAPGADIRYVTLPLMRNVDEAVPATLPDFERRIGQRIWESVEAGKTKEVDVSGLSWTKIAGEVLKVLSLTS